MARSAMILPARLLPRTRAGRAGMIAGGILVALIVLDVIALAATAVVASTAGLR